MLEALEAALKGINVTFNVNRPLIVDTVASHCLIQFARSAKKQLEVVDALLSAYFIDGSDISNIDVLLDIARRVGLDVERTRQVITDPMMHAAIREHSEKLRKQGITGVPTFVLSREGFNTRIKFSGAQPVEVFKQALAQLVEGPPS